MSDRPSRSRILLLVALGIMLVLSMPSADRKDTSDMHTTPSLPVDSSTVISDASGDIYDGEGDWLITQPTVYTDNMSIVVNGDLLIQDGGSLTLENSAINFNTTNPLLNVSDGGYLEGQDSYILEEGGGFIIQENYTIQVYGNMSWTGGAIRHFDEIVLDNSTLNATFANCDFAYGSGRIDIRRAHSINFSGCDFFEINCGHTYLIDTDNGNHLFDGGVLINDCTFGSQSQSSPLVSEGIVSASNWDTDGDFKILSSLFYEIAPSSSGYIVDANLVDGNFTIADNRFIRCENQIIRISDDGAVVSGNKFFGNNIGTFADVHTINMFSNDTKIEKNFFWNNTVDSDIHVTYGNNTIRWNIVLESPRKAIELDQEADGCIVSGNALYSNNVGLYIWEHADNQQIYLNAFLDNDQHAVDKNGTNAITWNNGTHGNYWDNYTGQHLTGNPWIGDSPFQPHENITDSTPSLMIGALPPSSGKWETDIPNVFARNDLTIDGNVEVSGSTGSIVLLSNSLRNTGGRTFTFGEDTVFMLQDAEITTTGPTVELGDFHLTDVFYFGVIESSMSNIRSESDQNDFTVSARMLDIENSTFTNIPGMRIDLHSDYSSTVVDWDPFGMCAIENNVFTYVKGDSTNPNAMFVEWPNINFKNNTIKAASPGREVQLFSQYQTSYPYDLFVTAEGCTIANASLNVTSIGDATSNITSCEVDEGIIAFSRFSGIYDTNVYIVGNTISSGGIQAGGRMWGATECYAHLDLNDNNVTGTTDLVRLSSCSADNNTFNDDLWLEDSSGCTFSSSDIRASIDFDGPLSSITFQDIVFNSSGTIDIASTGGACHFITFDNCTFDMIGWQLWSDCRFVNIIDSTFWSGLDISLNAVHNVTVQSSEFYLSGGTAIHIDGNNATIIDNTIVNSSHAIIIEGDSSQGKNPTVNGNQIANISGNAIHVAPFASEVQIEGNWISNCSGFGIRARYVSNHSVISNNFVELAGSYGIYIEAYPGGVHGYFSNVTHNVVRSCSGNGLEIEELYNSTIFNNTLTMNGGFGVVPTSCGDATFWLNILYENDAGNIDGAGGMHFDNGTMGNFWGPSGPDGNDYYHGYDDGTGNPWIGDVPYEVGSGVYDNYPLLHNQPIFLNNPAVIDTQFYVNFRLIVLNTTAYPQQDMWILQGGNLTLVGTTIEFQSDASHVQSIIVETGCELRMIGGATITANNTQATYGFGLRNGSNLVVDDGSIYRCGYGPGNPIFRLNITTFSFNNLRIGESNVGIELYNINLNVSSIRFIDCGVGMLVRDSSSCNISYLTFSNVDAGVQLNSSSNCRVFRSDFTGCNNYGISVDAASTSNLIDDNIFGQIPGTALHIASSNHEVYLNAFVQNGFHIEEEGALSNTYNNGTYGNFYFDYPGVDDDGNFVGDTPYSSAISDVDDTLPVMVYGNFPTPTGWTVDRTTAVLNMNYTITGNVEIHGDLMLFDTRLWINCSSTGEYYVNIYTDASFGSSGATLRALDSSYRFGIYAALGSSLSIENSSFIDLHGFESYTSDMELRNTTFVDVYDGVRLIGSGVQNLMLENCTVENAENYAIYIDEGVNVTIFEWIFDSVYTGVRYDHTAGTLSVIDSNFNNTDYVVNGNTAEKLVVNGVNGYRIVSRGIRCEYVGNATILNTHIEMNGAGRAFEFNTHTDYYLLWGSYAFDGTYGVAVYDYSNGTISENDFYNCSTGVTLRYIAQPATLYLSDNLFYGCDIGLEGQNNVEAGVTGNTFRYCGNSIYAQDSQWCSFKNNIFRDSTRGIYTDNPSFQYCQIANNSYSNVDYPIYITGTQSNFEILNETMNTCIDGVTLTGSGIGNVIIDNTTINGASGSAFNLDYCTYILLSNLTIDSFHYGIHLVGTENVLMNASILTNGDYAIHLDEPSLTMRDCTMSGMTSGAFEYADLWFADLYLDIDTSNTLDGLPIYSYFNVSNTVIYGHETYSLSVIQSSNVTLAEFEVNEMDDLLIFDSTNVTMSNSTIYADISMEGTNYTFIGNVFDNVTVDFISTMDNVTFTLNAFLTEYDFLNEWEANDFYLNSSEYGNYWYDYSGTDSDDDGIGDTPFDVTSAGETDYYPLMTNPLEYSVTITINSPLDGATLQGMASVSVHVDVDAGFYYEGSTTVSTSITVDGSEIGTGGEGDIEFDWNTTEHDDGSYTLKVTVTVNGVEDFTNEISITLDNTGPTLDPEIEDGKATDDSTPQWRVDATDDLSNLAWIAVYLDGSEVENESASGQSDYLYFTLSLSEEKSYELCLCSMDVVGNLRKVNLTIYYDDSMPDLTPASDISYEEGTTGNTITWVVNDLTPSHYNVTVDGESWVNGTWDGSNIVVDVDGLETGINYLYIRVYDRVGHYASDTAEVTVTTAGAPTIDHPADIEYDEGTTGHSITWSPSDSSPDAYVVYRNGSEVESDDWAGGDIEVDIDGLGLGVYNFTLVVNNTGGYAVADIVFVTVVDGTTPAISMPGNIWFTEGDTGWYISWDPDDDHPASYEIFRNETLVKSGSWNSTDENITISLDGLDDGVYNYTVIVEDVGGNMKADTVIVTVQQDTSIPTINSPHDMNFDEGDTGFQIVWDPYDDHPSTYEVLRNGTTLISGSWNSSSERIVVSLDGIEDGVWNYTVKVTDAGGNIATDTVMVTVNPTTTTTTTTTTTGTTTGTTETTTSTTTSGPPPAPLPIELIIAIVGVIGAVAVILVIVVMKKRK